jgi:peptide deformylase
MLNTIYDWVKNPNNNAWGLTLPQIWQSRSAFVICTPDNTTPTNSNSGKRNPKADYLQGMFINPVITEYSTNTLPAYKETCFSEPRTYRWIKRPSEITITYTNQNWQLRENVVISGNRARVIQHEYDHLKWKLLSDHPIAGNSKTNPVVVVPSDATRRYPSPASSDLSHSRIPRSSAATGLSTFSQHFTFNQ